MDFRIDPSPADMVLTGYAPTAAMAAPVFVPEDHYISLLVLFGELVDWYWDIYELLGGSAIEVWEVLIEPLLLFLMQ